MNGSVFVETLRRGWRTALYWGMGLAFYALYVVMIFGTDEGTRAEIADLMATKLPGFIGQAFGIPDDVNFLISTMGFLSFTYFTYVSLILAVWAVLTGLGVTANDEDSGTMNMILALPLPRWRLMLERIGANLVILCIIVTLGLLGTLGALQLNGVTDVDTGGMIGASLGLMLVEAVILAVTALLAVLVRRRSLAASLAGGFVAASFLLKTLGGAADSSIGTALQNISVFYHFDSAGILQHGLAFGSVMILLIALGAVSWGAVQLFQKRDIGG